MDISEDLTQKDILHVQNISWQRFLAAYGMRVNKTKYREQAVALRNRACVDTSSGGELADGYDALVPWMFR